MPESLIHSVVVKDKYEFLRALMGAFGDGGRVSLEGNLRKCRFPETCVLSKDNLGVLTRGTIWPKQQFFVLELHEDAIPMVLDEIRAAGLDIEDDGIIHVAIEWRGVLQLGAYDNFDEDCVCTGPAVSRELLAHLQSQGLIESFQAEIDPQWPGMEELKR